MQRNTIVCGDALEVLRGWPDGCVDLVVTDPPYNCGLDYGPDHDDKLPDADYLAWYAEVCHELYRVMREGYLYVSCTTRQLWTLRPLWDAAGWTFQTMVIWYGPNTAGSGHIVRQWMELYEPVMMFLKGKRIPMINGLPNMTTHAVQRIARPQSQFTGEQRRYHPAQKPVELYRRLIARTPGDLVLDPFMGSGTTAIAATKLGRDYVGIELNPDYIEIAERRLAEVTGVQLPLPVMAEAY